MVSWRARCVGSKLPSSWASLKGRIGDRCEGGGGDMFLHLDTALKKEFWKQRQFQVGGQKKCWKTFVLTELVRLRQWELGRELLKRTKAREMKTCIFYISGGPWNYEACRGSTGMGLDMMETVQELLLAYFAPLTSSWHSTPATDSSIHVHTMFLHAWNHGDFPVFHSFTWYLLQLINIFLYIVKLTCAVSLLRLSEYFHALSHHQ